MDAFTALNRSNKAIQDDLLIPTMEMIYTKIAKRCDGGYKNLSHIFNGHTIERHIERAVLARLSKEGYTVKYHVGDIRDQREVSYHEITWNSPQ